MTTDQQDKIIDALGALADAFDAKEGTVSLFLDIVRQLRHQQQLDARAEEAYREEREQHHEERFERGVPGHPDNEMGM